MENSYGRQICCCGARIWSLVIGWLQMICSIPTLMMVPWTYTIAVKTETKQTERHYEQEGDVRDLTESISYQVTTIDSYVLIVLVILLIFGLLEFIGSIFLITGVTQRNLKKIMVWKVLKIIIVVIVSIITLLSLTDYRITALPLACFVLYFSFSLWVVDVHRKELEASSGNFGYTKELIRSG